MATYAFSGRTRSGENVSGERIGDTMDAVVSALRREQIQVTKIQPTAAKKAASGGITKLKARGVPAKNIAVFTRQFSDMIDAGEAGGILDTILKRLATYIEKAVKLQSQVKSAMIYPVAVIVIAALVIGVILWKVIPTFAALFAGLGAQLPLPTRIVIALSDFLVNFMPFIIVGIGATGYGFKAYYGTP